VALVTLPLLLLCLPSRRPAPQPEESALCAAAVTLLPLPPPKEGYSQPRPEIGNPEWDSGYPLM
jgi:hypothetical protein